MIRHFAGLLIAVLFLLGGTIANAQQPLAQEHISDEIAAFKRADDFALNPCAVVFVGSSSIRTWRILESDMAPYSVVNRGFGGSTIADVNHYFPNLFARRAPPAIIFYAGENDIADSVAPDEVVSRFRQFLDLKNQALGDTPVFFISMKPSRLRFDQFAQQREVNRAIVQLARSRRDLHFVDVASRMKSYGEPRDIYVEDGLHMNAQGYSIWLSLLRPDVARASRRRQCAVGGA